MKNELQTLPRIVESKPREWKSDPSPNEHFLLVRFAEVKQGVGPIFEILAIRKLVLVFVSLGDDDQNCQCS